MDVPVVISSTATVGLVLTGTASSWAALISVRAAERLERVTESEAAALVAMVDVRFSGWLDTSTPAPRLVVKGDGAAVLLHGVDLGRVDARTAGGAAHPGPHPDPGPLSAADRLPRRLHRGESCSFEWRGGDAEHAACRSYDATSKVPVTAAYSICMSGPVEYRQVAVQLGFDPTTHNEQGARP